MEINDQQPSPTPLEVHGQLAGCQASLGQVARRRAVERFAPWLSFDGRQDNFLYLGGTLEEMLGRLHPSVGRAAFVGVSCAERLTCRPPAGVGLWVSPLSDVGCSTAVIPGLVRQAPCGDINFLWACAEECAAWDADGPILGVVDSRTGFVPPCDRAVTTGWTRRGHPPAKLVTEPDAWFEEIAGCRAVVANHTAPVVLALAAGIPAMLVPRDGRVEEYTRIVQMDLAMCMPSIQQTMEARRLMRDAQSALAEALAAAGRWLNRLP